MDVLIKMQCVESHGVYHVAFEDDSSKLDSEINYRCCWKTCWRVSSLLWNLSMNPDLPWCARISFDRHSREHSCSINTIVVLDWGIS